MRLPKPSPSMFVSIAALVIATSGTSYAAITIDGKDLKKNSVGAAKIKDNSLTGKDVKNQSLTGKDIKNKSLTAQDLADDAVRSKQVKDGSLLADDFAPGVLGEDSRWLLINGAGQIEAQSGGFTVAAAYPTLPNTAVPPAPDNSLRANGNVYINAGEALGDNAIVATIALQNATDQNGDGVTSGRAPGADANPEFSGEISASMCGIAGVVACAPTGTNDNNHFVVSPRNSDGSVTTENTRKRFYVVIS